MGGTAAGVGMGGTAADGCVANPSSSETSNPAASIACILLVTLFTSFRLFTAFAISAGLLVSEALSEAFANSFSFLAK